MQGNMIQTVFLNYLLKKLVNESHLFWELGYTGHIVWF